MASQNFRWIQVGGGVPGQNTGRGSHIKAQILLFFKEIVKDEFAHEVWVQRVVDHLCPSKLDGEGLGSQSQRWACKGGSDSRGQLWAGRGLSDSPPATPGWPGSACKAPPLQEGVGAGREGRQVSLHPLPAPQSLPHTKFLPAPPRCRLLGSDLEKVSRSSRFLEKATDRRTKGGLF